MKQCDGHKGGASQDWVAKEDTPNQVACGQRPELQEACGELRRGIPTVSRDRQLAILRLYSGHSVVDHSRAVRGTMGIMSESWSQGHLGPNNKFIITNVTGSLWRGLSLETLK